MSGISRARGAPYGILAVLCFVVATATAADYAGADPKSKNLARVEKPLAIALAMPGPSTPSPALPATATTPLISPPLTPALARFFTINEVMAQRNSRAPSAAPIRLASIDPGHIATDATALPAPKRDQSGEPFGLLTFVAPEGQLWTKWRKVEAAIEAEKPTLSR